jgi:hypothetical protein
LTQIAEVILSSNTATVSFTSIPATYRNLKLVCTCSENGSGGGFFMQFNGDTGSNYYGQYFYAQDGSPSAVKLSGTSNPSIGLACLSTAPASLANAPGGTEITIYDYARTQWNKVATALSMRQDSSFYTFNASVQWNNTAAIDAILLGLADSGSFLAGSVFTLYGF